MKKLPKFVIHLDRLNSDISNVSFLLQKYEEDRKRARMEITGKSIPIQRRYLSDFSGKLFDEIARVATEEGADQFGNEFEGMQNYQYAEMTVDPSYQVFSIRLLGDVEKPLDKQKRYTIFCADNIFDPTTINIISNLRGISDGEAKDVINKNEDPNSKGKPTIKNVPGRGKLGKKSCKDEELEELEDLDDLREPVDKDSAVAEFDSDFDSEKDIDDEFDFEGPERKGSKKGIRYDKAKGTKKKSIARKPKGSKTTGARKKIEPREIESVLKPASLDFEAPYSPELVKVDQSIPCQICLGAIKTGLLAIKCKCGKLYHESCGVRVGECPKCSRKFKIEKLARQREEELLELEEFEESELTAEEYEKKKKDGEKAERERIAKLIRGIEDRLAAGEISEETYLILRKKYEE